MSTQVSTTDEALARLRTGLNQWGRNALALATQSSAVADAALGEISAACSRLRSQLDSLKQSLRSMKDDDPNRNEVLARISRVEEELSKAESGRKAAEGVVRRCRLLERQIRRTASEVAPRAVSDLSRGIASLERYRSGGGAGVGGSYIGGAGSTAGASGGVSGSSGSGETGQSGPYGSAGLTVVDLDQVDFSDNPTNDNFNYHGNSRSDYRWMADSWDTTVRPGVERGMTREDFAARDAARGAPPNRQTANVYDSFMGDSAIRVERRPNGTLNPIDGRHRIGIARELGITHLPMRVI